MAGYLTQASFCTGCGLRTGAIRADDGPAWLTLLVVGHLIAPFMVLVFMSETLPVWASTTLMCAAAVALCLAVLPRAKGVFIAAIWKLGAPSDTLEEDRSA